VTSLVIEQFGAPLSIREARVLEFARERAADELAGRTVWCASAGRTGRSQARALRACLRSTGDESVRSAPLELHAREPLNRLAERLDSALRGRGGETPLDSEEEQIYSRESQDGDEVSGEAVRPGDVVVVHDPLGAALGSFFKAQGAHVVWRISVGSRQETVIEAWRFLHRRPPRLDAYVIGWRPPARQRFAGGLAALISSPGVVSAKETEAPAGRTGYEEITWTSLLADVVESDHHDRVGGMLHARPAVAAR
jgi:trehalose synthase